MIGPGARYLCSDCGRDLSGVRLSADCLCGSRSRRRIDGDGAAYRRPATESSPPWDRLKDWTVKYLQLEWNLGQLRLINREPDGVDAAQARRVVDSTFAAAVSLGEWLTFGAEPAAVTAGDIARFLATRPLSVCVALAQSASESEPEDGSATTARVVPVAFATRHQHWVEYRRPDAKTVRYDALGLAEECLLAWQSFLAARGVELPHWYR